MVLSFTPIGKENFWHGSDWVIEDEDQLAKLVAGVALGQHRQVLHILQETGNAAFAPIPTALAGAKQLLSVKKDQDPWHRDGWLFQVISWIAGNLQNRDAIIRPPHMIHAHKGFDGLHIDIDPHTNEILSVVISEEKATGSPRCMVRDRIWPDFLSLETGGRDNELVSDVSTLLAHHPEIDPDAAIRRILWAEARAYRVAITIGKEAVTDPKREQLFKGYKKRVKGIQSRRRAETLHIDDLRAWMESMSARAIAAAEEIEAVHV